MDVAVRSGVSVPVGDTLHVLLRDVDDVRNGRDRVAVDEWLALTERRLDCVTEPLWDDLSRVGVTVKVGDSERVLVIGRDAVAEAVTECVVDNDTDLLRL